MLRSTSTYTSHWQRTILGPKNPTCLCLPFGLLQSAVTLRSFIQVDGVLRALTENGSRPRVVHCYVEAETSECDRCLHGRRLDPACGLAVWLQRLTSLRLLEAGGWWGPEAWLLERTRQKPQDCTRPPACPSIGVVEHMVCCVWCGCVVRNVLCVTACGACVACCVERDAGGRGARRLPAKLQRNTPPPHTKMWGSASWNQV